MKIIFSNMYDHGYPCSEKKVGLARCRTTSSTKQYRKNKHMLKLQDLADKEGARRGRANSTASAGSDEVIGMCMSDCACCVCSNDGACCGVFYV